MCGSAGAWWGRGQCYLEWRHLLGSCAWGSLRQCASPPFLVSCQLPIKRVSQVGRDPISQIKTEQDIQRFSKLRSPNWVQQFFISAPQSLLPPHFSQALHSSAQVLFCVSVVLCSAPLINLFVSSGSAGSFPFIPSPFGCGQASTENVGNTCAFCDLLAGLVYP